MPSNQNAGSIVYEVDMDLDRFLRGQRQLSDSLNGMNRGFDSASRSINNTERSASNAERSFSSLTKVAVALTAALSVQQVAQYADAWVTVNNKLANAIRPSETLADVTQRVFDISQQTRSSLEATATLYARLERATRSAGTSTADLVKLTETINKGLAVSGATAAEASSTMVQLSQALASGVLRGEEFNSISENGSRLAVGLADSLGVTVGQLRAMAAQGKLTTDVVVKGLLSQGDAIAKEFTNTATTMGQALTTATNNVTKFVGESSTIKSAYNGFNSAIVTVSENLDVLSAVFVGFGAIMGGRFAGALAAATAGKIKSAIASQQLAAADSQAAQAALVSATSASRKAVADKEAALSAYALAQAEYNVAKGSAAEALALDALVAANSRVIATSATAAEAQMAQAAATTTAATAATAATGSMGLLRSALGLLGGPAGIVAIVAAGFYYLYSSMQQAKKESIEFADSLGDVISRMKEMSIIQLQANLDKATDSITNQKDALNDLREEWQDSRDKVKELQDQLNGLKGSEAPTYVIEDAQKRLTAALHEASDISARVETASVKLSSTQQQQARIQDELNQKVAASDASFKVLEDNLRNKIPNASAAAVEAMVSTIQVLDELNKKAKNNGSEEPPAPSAKAQQLIKNAERRLALSKLEGEARARLQAQYDAEDAGIDKGDKLNGVLQEQYAETERNTAARKENTKESKANANAQESIAQKLANLKQQSELTAGSTQDLTKEQAILRAQQSLGAAATQKDIELAGQYAEKIWQTTAALKAQNAVPELKENASYKSQKAALESLKGQTDANGQLLLSQEQYSRESERIEQEHQANLAKIKAGQAVTPIQEAQGSVDPVQQLANQHAQQLALIQQFETQKGVLTANGLALMNAANTQYEKARTDAQWEIYRNQSTVNELMASAIDGFSSQAASSLTGYINGTQTAAEATENLGNAILNSVIQSLVEVGIQYLKNAAMAMLADKMASGSSQQSAAATATAWAPAAAAASIATFGGAAVAGIAGMVAAFAIGAALAGKRKNGGPVTAGAMYEFGEGNLPEVFQSGGKNYMLPGNNGRVISNKDLSQGIPKASTGSHYLKSSNDAASNGSSGSQSGGGLNFVLNITNTNGSRIETSEPQYNNGYLTMEMFVGDMQQGGPMSRAITGTTSATRRAIE